MLLDDLMPSYDATRVEHRIVTAGPAEVFTAAEEADFLDAVRGNPAVRAMFTLRGAAESVASAVRGRRPHDSPEPESLRLADLPLQGEWVLLGRDPPDEIAFGAIGRFWGGDTRWEAIEAARFGTFDRPGFARIACNLTLRAYGEGRTLISYEARTSATDEASRRAFLRYWRVVSPFVGLVMRSTLRVIAIAAGRPAGAGPKGPPV